MKTASHSSLSSSAVRLAFHGKLKPADLAEARRLKALRSFTRKDKESLSDLLRRYEKP
jgi:hypothetical protein